MEEPMPVPELPPASPEMQSQERITNAEEREKPAKPDLVCANCSRPLKPKFKYCPDCGQKNVDRKVSLRFLLTDYVREELNLNNKTLRTFKLFLFKPGSLTVAYMQGQRKNWITPTKIFFWTGFLFLGMLIYKIDSQGLNIKPGGSMIEVKGIGNMSVPSKEAEGNSLVGRYLPQQLDEANAHPIEFIHAVIRKIPFVLLFILPFFALILKVLFYRRKVLYLEHLVYLLHLHAFGFLAAALITAINLIDQPWTLWPNRLILLIIFIYFLESMRQVYRLSWVKTVGNGLIVFFLYLFLVPASLVLLSMLASLVGG